ncbi:MAG TPA: hypothetical protein VGN93_17755 [Shinella sp.]|uniref:hypothetical protein n=1 Tax=Shinella sp. TaxID=1870904 RepID=UPI002E152C29|nr:hypothetical protein [Shinella sp.]
MYILNKFKSPLGWRQFNWMSKRSLGNSFSIAAREKLARSAAADMQKAVGIEKAIEILAELAPGNHWVRAALLSRPTKKYVAENVREILPRETLRKPGIVKWLDRKDHNRLKELSPEAFISTIYGERLGRGFTQADLRTADPSLYSALHRWLADPKNQLSINLPTLAQWNKFLIDAGLMVGNRLATARYYRRHRQTTSEPQ